MNLGDFARAKELETELTQWQEAERRAAPGVFKEAFLRVVDASHGAQGLAGTAQVGDVQVKIPAAILRPFILAQLARVLSELRGLGVEV